MRISVQIEFDKTLDVETPKNNVIVGRSNSSAYVVIPHDSISRAHCRIEIEDGSFYITDLGSSNGTFLDGKRLSPDKRTPFLTSQQVTLGQLECEISDAGLSNEQITKAESLKASIQSNCTTTIRIARLDLNKPSITLEMEKKNKIKGSRNPVTKGIEAPAAPEISSNKRFYWTMLLIIFSIVGYMINVAIK